MKKIGMAGLALLVACGGTGIEATTTEVPTTEVSSTTTTEATTTTTPTTTTTVPPPTTTTVPLPTLTQEVAAASLEEVAAALFDAWVNEDAAAYPDISRELQVTVSGVVSTHKRLPDTGWEGEFLALADGVEMLGDEFFPEGTFTRLAVIGVPGSPVTLFSGVYRIGDTWTGSSGSHSGDETTIPGTYVVLDVEDCYWERLDSAGEIIDNNFINAAPRVAATIRFSDFAFNSEGCGRWVRVSD